MTADSSPLERTRRSLHAVAEHVLEAALHDATGHIGLRAAPGAPADVYTPSTPLEPDRPLDLDPATALAFFTDGRRRLGR